MPARATRGGQRLGWTTSLSWLSRPPGEPGCWPESEGLSLRWGEESGALA